MNDPAPESVAAAQSGFVGRHQFLIYRLFSLAGLLPIGGYLCIHLLTNATILDGPATFQSQVDKIHALGILLPLVEWGFIFIPILFHATVGWMIVAGALPNTASYPYGSNFRYLLQRVTALIAFFFIMAHVIHMHQLIGGPLKGTGLTAKFDAEHASSSTAEAIRASLWIQIFYAVGVLSCVYHFANGLWTQGITWGVWITPAAQRRASFVCLGIGLILAAVGLGALGGMITLNVKDAITVEDRMERQRKLERGEDVIGGVGGTGNLPSREHDVSRTDE